MDYIVVRTHIINHARFLEAGPQARDIWQWGMLYAGQHETDGELPMVALLASPWGHGGKRNVVLANRLVEVGLWERTDKGYRIRKWAEQGNKKRSQIDESRAAARDRMSKRRLGRLPSVPCSHEVRANEQRTSPDVPASASLSSGSGSSSREGESERGTGVRPVIEPEAGPPSWFRQAVETVEANAGLRVDDLGARWLQYDATCSRDPRRGNPRDAAGWLTSTLRAERARAKADAERRKPYEPPEAPPRSEEQQKADAAAFVARVMGGRKTGS